MDYVWCSGAYEVYEGLNGYPTKDNKFVLGEIYEHVEGIGADHLKRIAGDNDYRYWVADVENPNILPAFGDGPKTWLKQLFQNAKWGIHGMGR